MLYMVRYGHPITITKLKIKVTKAIQLYKTHLKDGILGRGRLWWFQKHHLKTFFCISQGLDSRRAKGICPNHVVTFHDNLEAMLAQGYKLNYILNGCRSKAKIGRCVLEKLEGQVLENSKVWSICLIIAKEREWILILVCVNVANGHGIHIFDDERIQTCLMDRRLAFFIHQNLYSFFYQF